MVGSSTALTGFLVFSTGITGRGKSEGEGEGRAHSAVLKGFCKLRAGNWEKYFPSWAG